MEGPTAVDFDVPEAMISLFKAELEPGERLPWAGQSRSRRGLNAIQGWLIATILFLGSLTICIACAAIIRNHWGSDERKFVDDAASIGFISGLAAFLLLVGMIVAAVSRFGRQRPPNKVNFYALTDRRAILRRQLDRPAVEVIPIWRGQVEQVYRLEHPEGSGEVVLNLGRGHLGRGTASIEVVSEVRRVEDLARRVLLASGSEFASSP
jgi:hypothetical protein